jgi:hypothetical protein
MDGDDDDAFLYGGDVPATTRPDAPAQPQQPAGAVLEADAVAPPDGAPQAEPQLEQAAAEDAQDEEDSDEEDEDSDSVSRHAVSSAWPSRRAGIASSRLPATRRLAERPRCLALLAPAAATPQPRRSLSGRQHRPHRLRRLCCIADSLTPAAPRISRLCSTPRLPRRGRRSRMCARHRCRALLVVSGAAT